MSLYSKNEFSVFVGHHGSWDIYANKAGLCVALPVDPASGHKPSMFGMIDHARRVLERNYSYER